MEINCQHFRWRFCKAHICDGSYAKPNICNGKIPNFTWIASENVETLGNHMRGETDRQTTCTFKLWTTPWQFSSIYKGSSWPCSVAQTLCVHQIITYFSDLESEVVRYSPIYEIWTSIIKSFSQRSGWVHTILNLLKRCENQSKRNRGLPEDTVIYTERCHCRQGPEFKNIILQHCSLYVCMYLIWKVGTVQYEGKVVLSFIMSGLYWSLLKKKAAKSSLNSMPSPRLHSRGN